MSRLNKTFIALALGFSLTAQGPTPGTGGGFPPAPPSTLINQTAALGATTIATCPAGTAHFCLYLAAVALSCNPANPGTGTGSVTANLSWADQFNASAYTVTGASLNIANCSTQYTTSYLSYLDHPVMVGPGKSVTFVVSLMTVVGAFNYDVAWFALPLGQF